MKNVIKFMGALALAASSTSLFANPIVGDTCGSPHRTATMSGAAQCAYVPDNTVSPIYDPNGTIGAADIAYFYGDSWTQVGELAGADGTNGYLTATSAVGWGQIPNNGTFAIDASFWSVYDSAVITMHVGAGQATPDGWAWMMIDGTSAGTWSVSELPICLTPDVRCNGGGLSNIMLWGAGDGNVPEPGVLALLATGLIGMGVVRRRMKA